MRRRLYFLLPDLRTAHRLEEALLLARVGEPHIHFLAREDVDLGGLHVASLLQRSDLLHGMGIGLVAGGATGAFAGTLAAAGGSSLALGGVLLLAVLGALLGVWIAGMIAVSIPNSRLRRFHRALSRGQILLMVDVPRRRVREIRELIRSHYPQAEERGQESHIPVFP